MGIKIDKKFENSLMDCAIVDTIPSEDVFDSNLAETVLSWIAHSHITTKVDSNDITSYISYLDAKLSAVRKTATFWDAYNIRESASPADEFAQKYAALPNNSSLVINTGTLNIGEKTYNRGDIVIKDNYGNEVDVKNNLSGVYIPETVEKLDNNGNLQINFIYSSNKSLENPKIKFTGTTPNEGTIYSEMIESTAFDHGSVSRDAREFNGKPVIPFWECREYDPNTKVIKDKIFDLIQVQLEKDESGNDKLVFTALNKNIPFILLIK